MRIKSQLDCRTVIARHDEVSDALVACYLSRLHLRRDFNTSADDNANVSLLVSLIESLP